MFMNMHKICTFFLLQIASSISETWELLEQFIPDRIGHGTFLHVQMGSTEEVQNVVVQQKIPLGSNDCIDLIQCLSVG